MFGRDLASCLSLQWFQSAQLVLPHIPPIGRPVKLLNFVAGEHERMANIQEDFRQKKTSLVHPITGSVNAEDVEPDRADFRWLNQSRSGGLAGDA